MSYEEEDTCVSYEEEDTCVSYEEEDTCVSYEEEDACVSDQMHVCIQVDVHRRINANHCYKNIWFQMCTYDLIPRRLTWAG